MYRYIAAAVIAALVSVSMPGCSQPIDTGSGIPAQQQPVAALLALVGLGIAVAAIHHHNIKDTGGGGGGPVFSLIAPSLVLGLVNQPFDISLDLSQPGAVGALGTAGGGGNFGFAEVLSVGANNGSYSLPAGYQPRAVTIDGAGADWFVDNVGKVKKCAPPTPAVTKCVPTLSFSDGLAATGTRSIAADGTHVFIALDNQVSAVSWVSFALDGTGRIAGSYTYTPGLGPFARDAVVQVTSTLTGISTFLIFHKDGASYIVQLPGPATLISFKLTPPPVPTENAATDGLGNFFSFFGTPTAGIYSLSHYVGIGNSQGLAPGALFSTIAVANNGQTSPNSGRFTVPLTALHSDNFDVLYALDSSGNLVVYQPF